MKDALLNRIKELENDLNDLRSDLDATDHTHFNRHNRLLKDIQDKTREIEQIRSLIDFDELKSNVLI